LLDKEVIFHEDLENIFGKRPFEVEEKVRLTDHVYPVTSLPVAISPDPPVTIPEDPPAKTKPERKSKINDCTYPSLWKKAPPDKSPEKIRDALIEQTEPLYPIIDNESSVYPEITEPLDITFAEAFVKTSGNFVYCESEDEFLAVLQSFILEKDWPVLFCYDEYLHDILKKNGFLLSLPGPPFRKRD